MKNPSGSEKSLVISYLGLRKAIGIIAVLLPFVLVLGKSIIDGGGIKGSISAYYYTAMGNVFVGSLCAFGVFLMSYKGYEKKDDIAGTLACIFAIGVALFPTAPDLNATQANLVIGRLHHTFAALFFLMLTYFCLFLFTKSGQQHPTRRKKQRNTVYKICGYTMLASMALMVLLAVLLSDTLTKQLHPTFWLESIAVLAFGVSWLTKGEAILKDIEA